MQAFSLHSFGYMSIDLDFKTQEAAMEYYGEHLRGKSKEQIYMRTGKEKWYALNHYTVSPCDRNTCINLEMEI